MSNPDGRYYLYLLDFDFQSSIRRDDYRPVVVNTRFQSCIQDSKQYGDTLVVIVNGDNFLTAKKGKPFQDLATRMLIVSALRGVDYVVALEVDDDPTVIVALETIRPDVFTKGGDRIDETSIPEWATCLKHDIKVVSGVGLEKFWSSSDFLRSWEEHAAARDAAK